MHICLQFCPILCNPVDYSSPDSSVHGIPQAIIPEWVAMPSSRGSSQSRDQTCVSYVSCTGRWTLYHERHFSSFAQSCLTLCDPMNRSTPGFSVHPQLTELPKLMSIESMMPSNHLILCHPLLLLLSIFPSIRVFSNESFLHIRWPNIGISSSTSVLPMNIQG